MTFTWTKNVEEISSYRDRDFPVIVRNEWNKPLASLLCWCTQQQHFQEQTLILVILNAIPIWRQEFFKCLKTLGVLGERLNVTVHLNITTQRLPNRYPIQVMPQNAMLALACSKKKDATAIFRENTSVWRCTIKPERELWSRWKQMKHRHFECVYIQR